MKKIVLLFIFILIGIASWKSMAIPETYGPIRTGERLWNIATQVRPDSSISRYQAMLALLKANPHAFEISCNLNTLKIGQTLRIPTHIDMQALTPAQAVQEFHRQNKQWKAFRRKGQQNVCPPQVEPSTPKTVESPISQLTPQPTKIPIVVVKTTNNITKSTPTTQLPTPIPTPIIDNGISNTTDEKTSLPLISSPKPFSWNNVLAWFSNPSALPIMMGILTITLLLLLAFLVGWRLQKSIANKSVQKYHLSSNSLVETSSPAESLEMKKHLEQVPNQPTATAVSTTSSTMPNKSSQMPAEIETQSSFPNGMREKLDNVRAYLAEEDAQIALRMLREVLQNGTAEQQAEAKQLYEIHKKMNYLKQNVDSQPQMALPQSSASNNPDWQNLEQMGKHLPGQYLPANKVQVFELIDKIFELLDYELNAQGKLIEAYLNRPQQEFFQANNYEMVEKPEKLVGDDNKDKSFRKPRPEPQPTRRL